MSRWARPVRLGNDSYVLEILSPMTPEQIEAVRDAWQASTGVRPAVLPSTMRVRRRHWWQRPIKARVRPIAPLEPK